MASYSLTPRCGSVTLGCGSGTNSTAVFAADMAAFNISVSQNVENVTPYDLTRKDTKNVGSGTPDFDISVAAFALAGAAGNNPGITGYYCGNTCGAVPATGATTGTGSAGIFLATGLTNCIFQLDSNVTLNGPVVVSNVSIRHARMRGAISIDISGKNGGDFSENWAVS